MSDLDLSRDRRLTSRWILGMLVAIALSCWSALARAQTPAPNADETQEPTEKSWTIDSDELQHFSNRANRSTVHPELPGVRPIGFVEDESGQTIPLLSVGGTLRQVPVGEIVANGWRVVGVDRDSVEVSDGTQSLRLPFDRLERSLSSSSDAQPQPASAPANDESN